MCAVKGAGLQRVKSPAGKRFAPSVSNRGAPRSRPAPLQVDLENETIFPFHRSTRGGGQRRIPPMCLGHDDLVVLVAEITELNIVLRKHVWTLKLCSTHLHGTGQETLEISSGGFCSIDERRNPTA